MDLFQVIVRDNHTGKQYLYNVSADTVASARQRAREEHKQATNSSCEIVKAAKIS